MLPECPFGTIDKGHKLPMAHFVTALNQYWRKHEWQCDLNQSHHCQAHWPKKKTCEADIFLGPLNGATIRQGLQRRLLWCSSTMCQNPRTLLVRVSFGVPLVLSQF